MNRKVQGHMARAKENLEAANILLSSNSEGGPVTFAYFAMFHAATAMGLAEGRAFPACSGWLAAFGEAFSVTNKIDAHLYADLLEAYRLRQVADYDSRQRISKEVVESTLVKATEFVAMAENFLKGAGGKLEAGQNT